MSQSYRAGAPGFGVQALLQSYFYLAMALLIMAVAMTGFS